MVGKISYRKKWQTTSVVLPGNYMDRGAQWNTVHEVAKEADITEQLNNSKIWE